MWSNTVDRCLLSNGFLYKSIVKSSKLQNLLRCSVNFSQVFLRRDNSIDVNVFWFVSTLLPPVNLSIICEANVKSK